VFHTTEYEDIFIGFSAHIAALFVKGKDGACVSGEVEPDGDSLETEKANKTFLTQWEACLGLGYTFHTFHICAIM